MRLLKTFETTRRLARRFSVNFRIRNRETLVPKSSLGYFSKNLNGFTFVRNRQRNTEIQIWCVDRVASVELKSHHACFAQARAFNPTKAPRKKKNFGTRASTLCFRRRRLLLFGRDGQARNFVYCRLRARVSIG